MSVLKTNSDNLPPKTQRTTTTGGGLIDFDDVSAAVDGFWSGCRGLSLICRLCHKSYIQSDVIYGRPLSLYIPSKVLSE